MSIRRTYFSPDSRGYGLASEKTLEDTTRFASELGYSMVGPRKTLESALAYYGSVAKTWTASDFFLTTYPYFCAPIEEVNVFRWVDRWILEVLRKLKPHTRTILYVVDLPIEQHLAMGQGDLIDSLSRTLEATVTKCFDAICVFNSNSRARLHEEYGVPIEKFVEFELLDYGAGPLAPPTKELGDVRVLAYSGTATKAYVGQWLQELPVAEGVRYEISGPGGEWIARLGRPDMNFLGIFPTTQDLTNYLAQVPHFGIVARNPRAQLDYYNFTSSSKLSAYVTAGVPVLVPSRCRYIASLVDKYRIGFKFGSVEDIPGLVLAASPESYREIRGNCLDLGRKLASGFFFKRAVKEAEERLWAESIA